MAVLTVLILILIIPMKHDLIHSFVLVGVRFRVSKSDVDDVASIDFQ